MQDEPPLCHFSPGIHCCCYRTVSVSGLSISGLSPCRIYNSFAFTTNTSLFNFVWSNVVLFRGKQLTESEARPHVTFPGHARNEGLIVKQNLHPFSLPATTSDWMCCPEVLLLFLLLYILPWEHNLKVLPKQKHRRTTYCHLFSTWLQSLFYRTGKSSVCKVALLLFYCVYLIPHYIPDKI